jgi:D-3-phosphoglycerate dehydrogenase
MPDAKVLLSPSSFGDCGDDPVDLLRENGYEVVPNPYGRRLTAQEVVDLAAGCIAIVAGVEPLNAEVLRQLPSLKCISRVGVGMQNVDLDAAGELGIAVRNTPDGPTRPVAELTLALALALLRRVPQADHNLRNGIWQKEMGNLLYGKTVGVIGAGRIGRCAAELFLGVGCQVVVADPAPEQAWLGSHGIELLPLDDLLARSDIVSLHLSLPSESGPILGPSEFERMKPTAYLLNLARGDALDENALHEALVSGGIAGAALDVFTDEPYSGKLTGLDQVVLTPHIGSYAKEARLAMEVQAVQNLLDVLSNQDD